MLAVPALKAKYLANVRTIAEQSLDWKKLGPVVADLRKLIEKEVEADTRKLDSFEAFQRNTDDSGKAAAATRSRFRPGDEPPRLRRTTGKVPSRPSAQEAVKAHL